MRYKGVTQPEQKKEQMFVPQKNLLLMTLPLQLYNNQMKNVIIIMLCFTSLSAFGQDSKVEFDGSNGILLIHLPFLQDGMWSVF